MTRKRAKRKPPKRRSPVAAALRSPAFRKRVVPNKKKRSRVVMDFETRSMLTKPWEPATIIALFAVERF